MQELTRAQAYISLNGHIGKIYRKLEPFMYKFKNKDKSGGWINDKTRIVLDNCIFIEAKTTEVYFEDGLNYIKIYEI